MNQKMNMNKQKVLVTIKIKRNNPPFIFKHQKKTLMLSQKKPLTQSQ